MEDFGSAVDRQVDAEGIAPAAVVRVVLKAYRKISISYCLGKLLRFVPEFVISCPDLGRNNQYTTVHKCETTEGKINETFQFVLPADKTETTLIIEMSGENCFFRKIAGKVVIPLSIGNTEDLTINFSKAGGELDIEVSFIVRSDRDLSFDQTGLNEKELKFREKRFVKVNRALEQLFPELGSSERSSEPPVISMVGSGGGYRAMIGMAGAMDAIRDAGLLDALTYVSGLSGSGWYLSSAYGREGMNVDNQLKFHEELRESMSHSLYKFFIDAAHIGLYHSEYSSLKHKYGEPTTFVDFFGYTLGKALLTRKNIDKKLSDLQSYVKDGEVPYPIIVATSLKDGKPANEFYAYMENTPHAVSFPGYNIESEPQKCGSLWDQGFVLRESPELPLHFYMGCTGCAFSILLNSLIKNGGETSKHFLNFVESFREKELIRIEEARKKLKEEEDKEKAGDNTDGLMDFLLYPYKLWKDIRDYNILNHRNAVIERTGKMLNFVKNLGNLELHRLGQAEMKDVRQAEVAENLSTNFIGGTICTDNDVIDICDAGIVQNVCTNAVMDDRRTPDLVLVMDFNAYESDEEFDYMPLLLAWARSGIDGVRFPPVNSEALATKEPQELLIFESDGDDCPTVMWFTLYSRWFNDFPVFGEGTSFKTINFSNTPYQFDQLRELMYYNVSKNIDKIKDQIVKAIKRKTRRLANS